MKTLLCLLLLLPLSRSSAQGGGAIQERLEEEYGPLPKGPELMAQVRAQLPPMHLRLTGKVKARERKQEQNWRLVTELAFGAEQPYASYTLSTGFGDLITRGEVRWPEGKPVFFQWDENNDPLPAPAPEDQVAETGLTWSDLSLEFLWWPEAEVTERDLVKNRSAVVVMLTPPAERPDVHQIRLWVDERSMFIVRAELLDAEGDVLKKIEVDSIKKVREDFWMVKDLHITDRSRKRRMGIRFEEVEELEE